MTTKVFWQDPYLTRLRTRIAIVDGDEVSVEETIFYAEAGGQESDQGCFDDKRVLQARWQDQEIIYTLESGHGFRPGSAVDMSIDWKRRYRLMRLHFAAEIVLELAYLNLPGIEKIGAHIAADKARIDFAWQQNISQAFALLTEKANAIVAADRAIVSAFSDEAAELRYWEISDLARVPCGGTHLKRTGEIGKIELKRKNIGKGKERIEIYAAEGGRLI